MTRTDPPNPQPGPDWPAAPQPLHEQIETLGALLGRLIRRDDRPMIEHGIKAMRARLDEAELDVRGLAPDPETELAPAGIDWSGLLAPTPADDRAMRAAYRNTLGRDRATDTGTDGPAHWRALRGAALAFAYRLAERLPELGPVRLGADAREAIAAVLAFGPHSGPLHSLADTAGDVIDTVNQLLDGRATAAIPARPAPVTGKERRATRAAAASRINNYGTGLNPDIGRAVDDAVDLFARMRAYPLPAPAQIDGPTSTETAKLVALWGKLPDISRTAVVTSLLTMFVAHRNGSDALSALDAGHGLPVVGQGETTGPDGDECSQDCVCRAGWTEPGQ